MKVPADEAPSAPGSAAVSPPSAAPPPPEGSGAGPSASAIALAQIRLQLLAWGQHEPGARQGDNPEELHQLRVAVRRIDAILGLFKHQLHADLVRARRTAKGILRTLGAARDFDVQLAELDRYCESLSAAERLAGLPLRSLLEAQRSAARARMIRRLDGDPAQLWLKAMVLGSTDPAGRETDAAPAAIVMPERVQKRFRRLRKAVRELDDESDMENYHLVRRRAKLLRYALEPGAQLFGKPAEEMLRALRRLQDGLGEHQDAHLAKSRLEAIAADPQAGLPPETLFLMGRLAEHHLKVTRKARKTLARAWDKVRGKRWKSLRTKMDHLSAAARKAQARAPEAPATHGEGVTVQPGTAAAHPRPLRH